MNHITYDLTNGEKSSSRYYKEIENLSGKVIENLLIKEKIYIDDFMKFIKVNKVEVLRSEEEYGIEIFLIGVMLKEYLSYGRGFMLISKKIFKTLNFLREKDRCKKNIDSIRGRLFTSILMKRKIIKKNIDLDDFKLVVIWMESTGDFKEEVLRIRNWISFLDARDNEYVNDLFSHGLEEADYLYNEGKYILGEYTSNVGKYLECYKEKHLNKEDIIYCGKNEIQYFFNMVAAEIMNKVYREEFLETTIKKVFTPSCMRQVEKECLSEKSAIGYICKNCTKNCNVNKLTEMGKKEGFQVYIIPHETMLFSYLSEENSKIGIVGIACVLNLVSGGWKALRLGFKPQCVVLDYCGCDNHWLNNRVMTSINIDRIKKISCK
ncbi:DUF116 domain-containing protein [Clostridium paraputrificum]|uniref:DUF116 domain-containing protein n=1 Tax=Clostridium paraputrificum TaxID=29363 RepID=UPI003D3414B5